MSTIYMITAPRNRILKREWKEIIKTHDIHKWIIAKETGQGGYEHWQVRLATNLTFEQLKNIFPEAHIEQSTEWSDYERKEANYVCSEDTSDILRCRYGKLRENQRKILQQVYAQSDRGIHVVFDERGGSGKSFLCRWLFERNIGFYVPPTVRTTQGIIQFVASGYRGQRIIVIDIPRSSRWTNELYEGIEAIKDGLVYDTRYSAKMKDIWGVKILCLTNTRPKLSALSTDRWNILNAKGEMECVSSFIQPTTKPEKDTQGSSRSQKTKTKKTSTSENFLS